MIANKRGRNDPCTCGSGKKYKKCCLSDHMFANQNQEHRKGSVMNVFKHTFKKYNPRFDFAFVDTNEGDYGVKMSKIILEYVDELLTKTETYEDMECVIMIAIMAWNSALMGDENAHADIIDKTVPEKYSADVIELFMYLIEKKHRDYPFIDRFIVDYAIASTKTGYDLNIVSVIRP